MRWPRRALWRGTPSSRPPISPAKRSRSPPGSTSTRTTASGSRSCEAMVFLMPGDVDAIPRAPSETGGLTPKEIVAELDKFVIGQQNAKRAVAVALRNRWRRLQLLPEIAREILPKNILMIGPTGVGKTEIARRLARLARAPFLKIEASKFTEVGYVGRDVQPIA